MKLPACRPFTESMVIAEFLLPNLTVDIPDTSEIGLLLNSHLNVMGLSPEVTIHDTLAVSP